MERLVASSFVARLGSQGVVVPVSSMNAVRPVVVVLWTSRTCGMTEDAGAQGSESHHRFPSNGHSMGRRVAMGPQPAELRSDACSQILTVPC